MNRRGFVKSSLIGMAGLRDFSKAARQSSAAVVARSRGATLPAGVPTGAGPDQNLFPLTLPSKEWVQFRAAGFNQPACGVIYRRGDEVLHGMPLGGISTGFLDVETNGTFGLSTLFNSGVPMRGPLRSPFLGINVDGRAWVLTLEKTVGAENAREMHYWGHYPIADIEYETTAPISVGLRAWTPFIPGDARASNIPAAVFEVHLRNTSPAPHQVDLIFNFPGPTQAEAQIAPDSLRATEYIDWFAVRQPAANGLIPARRKEVQAGAFRGISVSSDKGTGYALGVLGEEKPRFGGSLGLDGYDFASGHEWAVTHKRLPPVAETEFASSLGVDQVLPPGETKTVRIVLAWYSPIWKGEGDHYFHRMYAKYYKDAPAVAEAVAKDHASLLGRVLAWQETLYAAEEIPVWLRESLANILHLITRTSYWAQAKPPIGDWCREDDGLFGLNECPRECPQIECLPCSFYGNIPVVYFFPELALSTLRGYKAYQYPDGAPPWVFGGCTAGAAEGYKATDGAEMAVPSPGYQTTLNGPCYVDMVDRYWQRTGNDAILKEFYPSIKKSTIYTMKLRSGPDGIVSVPEGNRNPTQPHGTPGTGLDWFEGNGWFGMTPHVGGIHLAQLRMAGRMAERVGDHEFAEQCKKWLEQGSASMESKLWTDKYYLAYFEPESGKRSELVFGYQLDGDWMCFYHGLPGVFRPERAKITLDTIRRTCMALAPYGAANFANADGTPTESEKFMAPGWEIDYGVYGYFPPEVWMLAATYLYQGEREVGLQLARNTLQGFVKFGHTWTQPNMVNGATGERIYGSDYYQNLMLWALPAAIVGNDLARACSQESLVERVIKAGNKG
jgi:uncharacterized protein (DUF608 family)